ncbi:MAG: LysR substrate-binding domain-containing protein [Paludibacteraceae bacterium]|nr:LysR family transcriptional regulator [Candidatus Colicola coprequi]MCQ2333912.1 LysR substrate-binding domain-containing protein [Paludibacteraceae bacterium]
MELRQLRYFVATAEYMSFSEAARHLFISQSTLSQQIRQLEDELGSPLFKRDSHTMAMTEAGDRLLPIARQTLQDAELCRTQVTDLRESLTGTLNMGVTSSFCSILSEPMSEFVRTYRDVKLNIIYTHNCDLLEMLRRRQIDFALAFKSENTYDDVESHLLFTDRLCAVVSKYHALAERRSVTPEELLPYGIAIPAKGVQGRSMLDEYLERTRLPFRVRIESNSVGFLADLLDDTHKLVGLLPGSIVRKHDKLVAIPVDAPHCEMQACVHVLRDNYVKRSASVFVKLIRESTTLKLMNMSL